MSLSRQLDRLAIALSAVCLIHCLAVTLLFAVLPLAAVRFGGDAHFHWLMLWVVLPTSILGLYLGFRGHGRPEIAGFGLVGMSLLSVAALTGHDTWPEYLEVLASVAGSLILAGAHWTNFTEVRRLQLQA
ncbi:MAG: MerC domain-containing protein [Gammaproteobacteria bacterium]